jgi:hypothetical protein
MARCDQELCPNWGGDGRVCECVQLDLEPGEAARALRVELGDEVPDGD